MSPDAASPSRAAQTTPRLASAQRPAAATQRTPRGANPRPDGRWLRPALNGAPNDQQALT
eukprot:6198239-Pleurochrysis_carterae.AAC.7